MTSRLLLLAGAAALVLSSAMAEPPHGPNCPPGHHDCRPGPDRAPGPMHGQMGGAMHGPQAHDWDWQDGHGGWHRDHDRYWQPGFAAFAPRDRIFVDLRRHNFIRFDGDPYWFQGRFVVKSFDRAGRPVIVEINPYTGAFIGVIRF